MTPGETEPIDRSRMRGGILRVLETARRRGRAKNLNALFEGWKTGSNCRWLRIIGIV